MDIFCGAGGSSAGARSAGGKIVHGIDAWNLAALTYQDNFRRADVHIRELGPSSQPPSTLRRGDIDMLIASPECTNHSPAKGSRPRCEDSRRTSNYVLNFASRLSPRWIILENVIQLRTWHGFHSLVSELQNLNYNVRLEVLDAAKFGVPQTRRRLFILCDRDRQPKKILNRTRCPRPASDIIQFSGTWKSTPLYQDGRALPTLERAERAIAALGKGKPFLIVYYGSDGAGGWQQLNRPLRTLTTLDRFGLVTWDAGEPMLRMLQVEELRCAMGLPQTFRFNHGTRRDKIKMIGNGVCPPVMEAVVESLVTTRS